MMELNELRGKTPMELLELLGLMSDKLPLLERFAALPFPDKKSEAYRYADMEKLWGNDLNIISPEPIEPRSSKSLVITDGVVSEIPDGVSVSYIDAATVDMEHHDPIYYLSHAMTQRVIEIEIPDNYTLVVEHHQHRSNTMTAYRMVFKMAPNTRATIAEKFADMSNGGGLVIYGYDLVVPCDANLTMVKDETLLADQNIMIASHAIDVDDNGSLYWGSFDFGAGSGVQQLRIILGERSDVRAAHMVYADDNSRRGTISHIVHRGRHSSSRQSAKNILRDTSRGIFDALIMVEPTARYTKAHQNNKAVLLNDGAYMASKPQLEIYIDELEASHGSTTGQLDERQLFYLRSRGISEEEARKMLILAFANEIIDTIADTNIREQVHVSFENAYYGYTQLECLESCHGCEES